MKGIKGRLLAVLAVLIAAGVYYYVALPAINIHNSGFWIFLIGLVLVILLLYSVRRRMRTAQEIRQSRFVKFGLALAGVLVIVFAVGSILSSPIVNAKRYQQLIVPEERDFTEAISIPRSTIRRSRTAFPRWYTQAR